MNTWEWEPLWKRCQGVAEFSAADLEKFHTKQLLKMRQDFPGDDGWHERTCGCCPRDAECEVIRRKNHEALRAVLATRPHVLNKQESKARRKQRKKQGK